MAGSRSITCISAAILRLFANSAFKEYPCPQQRVLVVGGGLAGLAAAMKLAELASEST